MRRLLPRLALLTLASALAACTSSEAPRPATVIEAAPSYSDLGALRVHYNVLPTLAMNRAMAASYGVPQAADQALLVVALRHRVDGDGLPADGTVRASAVDLSGRRQQIALRPVRTGEYTDHVGLVTVSRHDTLRFELQVQSAHGGGVARFQRSY